MRTAFLLVFASLCLAGAAGAAPSSSAGDYAIDIKIPSFLGNDQRRYYGKGPVPDKLDVLWKKRLGWGKTRVYKEVKKWYGTGWHGQPVLAEENGTLYVLVGSFDYNLWKMKALTGDVVWKHPFKNVIKSVPTIFINEKASSPEEKAVILCGSRRDFFDRKPPKKFSNFRAISLASGRTIWTYAFPRTESYSTDMDDSGLLLGNLLYLGAENGMFYIIDPLTLNLRKKILEPHILKKLKLYTREDVKAHKNNVVIESYPACSGDTVYVSAGSGHIYGISRTDRRIVWDFFVGSDIDSTPVITRGGYLLCGIEKQYIKGNGGVIMLDPRKPPAEAVKWFFPTGDRRFAEWEGGIIGSVCINDEYNIGGDKPALAAFCALDGFLYVVAYDLLNGRKGPGPDGATRYPQPRLVWKERIGPSISTPIFVDNTLIACGYDGKIRVFTIDYSPYEYSAERRHQVALGRKIYGSVSGKLWQVELKEKARAQLAGSIESTPIVWEGKIFIGTRGGYFYCLGDREKQ